MTLITAQVAPSINDLKAALTTDNTLIFDQATFKWTPGNFTLVSDDTNIIESDHQPLSVGAWVRQSASSIQYKAPATAAAAIPVADRLGYEIDLFDALTATQRSAVRSGSAPDVGTALQAIIKFANDGDNMSGDSGGICLKIRPGRYSSSVGIQNKLREDNSITDDRDLRRMNIEGGGSANTEINFALGSNGTAIDLRANNQGDGRLMGTYMRGLRITHSPIGTRQSVGVRLDTIAGYGMEDVKISGFDLGLLLQDVLQFHAVDTELLGNTVGLRAQVGTWTYPNVISWQGGAISGNFDIAAHIKAGSAVSFRGVRFEGNGNDRTTDYAIFMEGSPPEGRAWLTVDGGCYFEGNKVVANIMLAKDSGTGGAVIIAGNTFNQASADRYALQNINMFGTGATRVPVVMMGNGFLTANDYVAGTGKMYTIQTDHFDVTEIANREDSPTTDGPNTNGFVVKGREMFNEAARALIVNTAGTPAVAANRNGNIAGVSLISSGRVQINFKRKMRSSNYFVQVAPYNAAGYAAVIGGTNMVDGVQVETRLPDGTPTNMSFNLTMYGDFA